MTQIIVKICGITNEEDALAAVDAGADLLGFNFYPKSSRYISPGVCQSIVAALQSNPSRVKMVGVFVNAPVELVSAVLTECHLDLAQLHGDEPSEHIQTLAPCAYKALRPASPQEAQEQADRYARPAAPALLVDALRPGEYGGTGQTGDWSIARSLAEHYPILLAGGLTAENIHRAVNQVRPWGVDVASGVESSPGKKDPARLQAFIQAVRACEKETNPC